MENKALCVTIMNFEPQVKNDIHLSCINIESILKRFQSETEM